MVSSEVQRTLVKSPPELWAELSDPAALGRHLGELGEIRITRVEPEQKVEWEAEETSGTVLIDPSGWGTRVTLKVTREITAAPESPDASGASAQAEATAPGQPVAAVPADPEPSASFEDEAERVVAIDHEPAFDTAVEPDSPLVAEPELQPEPEPALEDSFIAELEPRRGFFARMFRRHRAIAQPSFESAGAGLEQAPEPAGAFAAVRRALAPETFAAAHPFATAHLAAPTQQEPAPLAAAAEHAAPAETESRDETRAWADREVPAQLESPAQPETEAQRADDISAQKSAAGDAASDEVTAVLTSVLDRLGAAHHRPFSRA